MFKKSKVVPIHKKVDHIDVNNYRPIKLVPTLSKIFEYLLKGQLYNYFDGNGLFMVNQFDFILCLNPHLVLSSHYWSM